MIQRFCKPLLASLLVVLLATPAGSLWACSVPVFRYALERWANDPYQVVVFHRGEMPDELKSLADRFASGEADDRSVANMQVHLVDLDAQLEPQWQRIWDAEKTETLPWMVVFYPPATRVADPKVWSGPFNLESVQRLVDSPLRREIARRVLKGDTAVWVLLEIGKPEADDAAFEKLKARLKDAEENLELEDIDEADVEAGLIDVDPSDLKIAFSTLRLSRDDPAEKMFVEMLLSSEDDLRDLAMPMAFPVFGRGRVLYALVGAGINHDTIDEACRELIGPCTCQVKDENPGTDLLMSVNWNDLVVPQTEIDKALPPLTGVADLVTKDDGPASTDVVASATILPAQSENSDVSQQPAAGSDQLAEGQTRPEPASPEPAAAPSVDSSRDLPEDGNHSRTSDVVRNTVVLIVLCAAGVIAASFLLIKRMG